MKRSVLFVLFTLSLHTLVNAQPAKDSATTRAVRQLKMMEKQLHLSEDQVLQLQVILINRDVAMDSLARTRPVGPSAPPGSGRASNFRRSIQQDADQKINAILTDDQKTLYQQFREKQKERMQERRQQQGVNNPTPQ